MIDKLQLLHPEIALFIATCVVLVLGLSRRASARGAAHWTTAGALLVAAWLGARSPDNIAGANMPHLLPYAKTMIALISLLVLPLLAGAVDRGLESRLARGEAFEPLRTTRGEFYAFYLFSVTGVMLCATADDLIWLFLALELTSLPTYIMVAIASRRLSAQEAGVKYFFLGALGAAIFLYGFALIYGATGTTHLPSIWRAVAFSPDGLGMMGTIGMIFAIVGIAFKIAAVPMHFYAADVYQGAAAPVAAYLAFAPKAAGFLALIALLSAVGWTTGPEGNQLPDAIRLTLWIMAATTMTIGNVLALLQRSVKRMLAYSSIAHTGYMLVGVIAGPALGRATGTDGVTAALFYLAVYGVMNLGAFAVIGCLERHNGSGEHEEAENIDDIKGLCRSHPVLGWCLVICALSLLGFPPLLGFWGKLAIFAAGIRAGEYVLVVVLAINSAIAAWYYIRLATAALLEQRPDDIHAPLLHPAWPRRVAAVASAAGCVVLVLFVSWMHTAAHRAATQQTTRSVMADDTPRFELTQRDEQE